jgi:galactokinase
VSRTPTIPPVCWSAPGRVNLIGEHTDYNDGFVLPIATPQRTVATVIPRADDLVTFTSAQAPDAVVSIRLSELEAGAIGGWAAYPAGVIWALRHRGAPIGGVDVLVDGHVPSGAGLSSSAALECSVAAALNDAYQCGFAPLDLAIVAQHAETGFVGMPCGVMDQTASLCCEEGRALFLDVRLRVVEQVPFDPEQHGLTLLVIDTKAPHRHATGDYAARRRDCERAAAILKVDALRDIPRSALDQALGRLTDPVQERRVRHVITENERVLQAVGLLRSRDLDPVGELLTASHRSLRDDFEVSCPELDVAVDAAIAAGALGARMTGGGFGGSAIALVPTEAVQTVSASVRQAFGRRRFGPPEILATRAAGGAALVWRGGPEML